MKYAWFSITCVASALLAAGCSEARCSVDADCFDNERCLADRCTVQPAWTRDQGAFVPDAATRGDVSTPPARRDIGVPVDMDMEVMTPDADSPDAVPADTSGPADMTIVQEDVGLPDAQPQPDATPIGPDCRVDPFTFICADDGGEPNNIYVDSYDLTPAVMGCAWSDFQPFQATFDATMCPLDGEDWFEVRYGTCDNQAFVIEWQVELLSDCDLSVVDVTLHGTDCSDPNVDCSIVDGRPTVRQIILPPAVPLITSSRLFVSNKGSDDVAFDYRIHVEIR